MKVPLRITFHQMDTSPTVEAKVREKVEKLEAFSKHITACRVSVESSYKHNQQGNLFHIVINLDVPNNEIVVSREHGDKHSHEDVYVAIRDAFDSARRQLEDYERRQRGKVKHHSLPEAPEPE